MATRVLVPVKLVGATAGATKWVAGRSEVANGITRMDDVVSGRAALRKQMDARPEVAVVRRERTESQVGNTTRRAVV